MGSGKMALALPMEVSRKTPDDGAQTAEEWMAFNGQCVKGKLFYIETAVVKSIK